MKTSELIGKKVLDDNANEIGKIQDIDIELKENNISKVFISSNELSLRKDTLTITPDMISEVGDYLLLNVSKSEISKDTESKEVPDVEVVDPSELEKRTN